MEKFAVKTRFNFLFLKEIIKNFLLGSNNYYSDITIQILHPDLSTWGSIIRLYGSKSANKTREVKRIDREITRLQRRAKVNSPNYAVLNKLFEELKKLSVQVGVIKLLMIEMSIFNFFFFFIFNTPYHYYVYNVEESVY